MGKRQREWAHRLREWLFDQLGRKCNKCGTMEGLTFDVIVPADNGEHHRDDYDKRQRFYRAQFHAGNLQVLCHSHNSRKKDTINPDEPF